jgi:lipopolysaccharide biosynthesis glycosyltransferase
MIEANAQQRPLVTTLDICSIADRRYLRHYATLLASIAHNNPADRLRFHLIWEGAEPDQMALFDTFRQRLGLSVNVIEVNGVEAAAIRALGKQGHVSHHTYYRLLLPKVLPHTHTALYLDVDIVVNGLLEELLNTDVTGVGAAVVREKVTNKLLSFGVAAGSYFNSGVMLINLDYWREHIIGDIALRFAAEHPEALLWQDQCALNYALAGQVRYLDPEWNCTAINVKRYLALKPVIVHFSGRCKPWDRPTRVPYGILYANYSQLTPWPIDYFDPRLREKTFRSLQEGIARKVQRLRRKVQRLRWSPVAAR